MHPYGASGFQNLSNMSSSFEFSANETSRFGAESENPTFSSRASLSKPRIAKTRKSLSSKSKGSSGAWKNDVGYNPFRPDMENVARVSSRLDDDKSSGVDDGVGDGDGIGIGIGRSRHLKLKVTNKVEKVGNELVDEIRKLRIANESVRSESGNKLDGKANASKAVGNDLPSNFSSSAGSSLGGGVNVSGSAAVSLGAELPNDLRKLNLKDDGEVGGRKFDSITLGKNDFVFGSSRANVDSVVDNTLPDNIKNLKLEDSDRSNGNRAFVSGSVKIVSSSGGVEDTMVLGEMEKLNIGGTLEGSSNKANLNESTSLKKATDAGIGEKDCSKPNLSENVSLGRDNIPQAPDLNKSSGLFDKSEGFSFTSKQDGPWRPNSEFRTPEPKDSLFNGSTMNLGFRSKKGTAKASMSKGRKGKVKEPKPVFVSLVNNFSPMETSYQNEASSDSYSPMDVSPCEIQDDPQLGGEPSSTSNDPADEQLKATECMDINEGNVLKQREESMDVSKCSVNIDVDRTTIIADNDRQSEVTSMLEVEGSDQTQYFSASSSISSDGSSFKFAASSSSHGQASATLRHQRKKNRMKAGLDISVPPKMDSLSDATSPLLFSPISNVSLPSSHVRQNTSVSTAPLRNGISRNIASSTSKIGDAHSIGNAKRGTTSPTATARIAQEACEKWRLRGNQAYANGDLKKAEDYYTQGLSCIPRHETSRDCLRSLVLCHSNRAAARMSIGRVSEALQDCVVATEIDPNFFRVQLRAANCYLALGEFGNASRYFKRLMQSTDVCVERKIILEASDGLQKAQKVSECLVRSTLLLRQKTSSDTESALEIIAEALVISPYSEQLLEYKARALFMLRRYDEVIQLCEETLETAEKNFSTSGANELSTDVDAEILQNYSFCTWRFGFIFKSNFYLGKLEEALEFLEKQEKWSSMVAKFGNEKLESLIPHLSTVRELLRHKSAGNRAFQTGKHTEAVEHYSAALSFNVESRPFAAVCFGNRAAAYQALGQITDAVADCSLSIALDANYSKAILRRATLFELIRDYDQAAKDLERLISLLTNQTEEKSNPPRASVPAGTVADLRQTRQRLYQMEEQAKRGIPLNFYLILGVEPSVTATDLKKAYRKAALKHHPDKAGQSLARSESGEDGLKKEIAEEVYKETDKLFKMIGEAYAVLSDPTKRSEYDIEEEMRNDLKKNGNPMSRMPNEEERGSFGRHWREGWRSSASPYSRGFEPTRPSRYY